MEEIETYLKEIIEQQLEECKKNKTIPSKEVLSIVNMLLTIKNCSD